MMRRQWSKCRSRKPTDFFIVFNINNNNIDLEAKREKKTTKKKKKKKKKKKTTVFTVVPARGRRPKRANTACSNSAYVVARNTSNSADSPLYETERLSRTGATEALIDNTLQ
jgi:phenylalanyl-tRNA synthetase beta subunit